MGIIFENSKLTLPGIRDRRVLPSVSFEPSPAAEMIELSNTPPVVWSWTSAGTRTAAIVLTADRTIDIIGAVNGASARLIFNPKGFNLNLPVNSRFKVGYFNGILWGTFALPTDDNLYELEAFYYNNVYYWTLSSYDFNL